MLARGHVGCGHFIVSYISLHTVYRDSVLVLTDDIRRAGVLNGERDTDASWIKNHACYSGKQEKWPNVRSTMFANINTSHNMDMFRTVAGLHMPDNGDVL